jgi:hypothetical protein
MLLMGIGIGVAFPAVATLFVEARSTTAMAIFVFLCVAAGLGLGLACYFIAVRTSRNVLSEILTSAGSTLSMVTANTSPALAPLMKTGPVSA